MSSRRIAILSSGATVVDVAELERAIINADVASEEGRALSTMVPSEVREGWSIVIPYLYPNQPG